MGIGRNKIFDYALALAITLLAGTILPYSISAEPTLVLHCENPARVINAVVRPGGGPSSVTDNQESTELNCQRVRANPESLFKQIECDGKWSGAHQGASAHLEIDASTRSGAPVPGILDSANFGRVAVICQEK